MFAGQVLTLGGFSAQPQQVLVLPCQKVNFAELLELDLLQARVFLSPND